MNQVSLRKAASISKLCDPGKILLNRKSRFSAVAGVQSVMVRVEVKEFNFRFFIFNPTSFIFFLFQTRPTKVKTRRVLEFTTTPATGIAIKGRCEIQSQPYSTLIFIKSQTLFSVLDELLKIDESSKLFSILIKKMTNPIILNPACF